jgi:hypothetical protein
MHSGFKPGRHCQDHYIAEYCFPIYNNTLGRMVGLQITLEVNMRVSTWPFLTVFSYISCVSITTGHQTYHTNK